MQIDLLPEILQPPRILSDVEGALKAKQIKGDIDEYLKVRVNYPYNCLAACQQMLIAHSVGVNMFTCASYIFPCSIFASSSPPPFVFVYLCCLSIVLFNLSCQPILFSFLIIVIYLNVTDKARRFLLS